MEPCLAELVPDVNEHFQEVICEKYREKVGALAHLSSKYTLSAPKTHLSLHGNKTPSPE